MLNDEEIKLWNEVFSNTKDCELKIEKFIKIFHCDSYFSSIAGLDPNEYTTQSCLIGFDHNKKYQFIIAVEYIGSNDYPTTYNLELNTFDNYQDLLKIIHTSWSKVRAEILHFGLNNTLDVNLKISKKAKI